jgi:hypothetical protein
MHRGIARLYCLPALALAAGAGGVSYSVWGTWGGAGLTRPAAPAAHARTLPQGVFSPDGQFHLLDGLTGQLLELRGISVDPQDLPGVTLTSCRLIGDWRGYSLRGAYLWECNLSAATLSSGPGACNGPNCWPDADLTGATYDRRTRWPAGFDPRAAGAVLDE